MKYYAVRKGKKTGIFMTWDECKENVYGFKGAEYKSFKTKEEAENFFCVNKENLSVEDIQGSYAYIDGSYNAERAVYGSGAILVKGQERIEFKKAGDDPEYIKLHNVAGEIEAVKLVLTYAVKNNIKEITLVYDYTGIEKWAEKEWKANKEYTKEYVKFVDEIRKYIKVNFVKVTAHSGVELNERADKLAKEAIEQF